MGEKKDYPRPKGTRQININMSQELWARFRAYCLRLQIADPGETMRVNIERALEEYLNSKERDSSKQEGKSRK